MTSPEMDFLDFTNISFIVRVLIVNKNMGFFISQSRKSTTKSIGLSVPYCEDENYTHITLEEKLEQNSINYYFSTHSLFILHFFSWLLVFV